MGVLDNCVFCCKCVGVLDNCVGVLGNCVDVSDNCVDVLDKCTGVLLQLCGRVRQMCGVFWTSVDVLDNCEFRYNCVGVLVNVY